ncbi:hypothetical protein CHUAL_013814 [Chamberlinius hualienensis]
MLDSAKTKATLATILIISCIMSSVSTVSAGKNNLENNNSNMPQHREKRALFALLIPLLLFGSIRSATSIRDGQGITGKSTIIINNWTNSDLIIQCKSKKGELEIKTIRHQESCAFAFKSNFLGPKSIWCDIWWQGLHKCFMAFDKGISKKKCNIYDIYNYGLYQNGVNFQEW